MYSGIEFQIEVPEKMKKFILCWVLVTYLNIDYHYL